MAFNDILGGFEGSRCDLDQYVAFKQQLFREHQKDPSYEFDKDKLKRKWSLGYDVTKNIWDTVKRLPEEIRGTSVIRNRLHVIFTSPGERYARFTLTPYVKESTLDDIAEAIFEDEKDDTWVYKRSPIMRKNSFQHHDDFIRRMLGPETSFDKALLASCKTRAGLFIGDFGRLVKVDSQPDPQAPSVQLQEVDSYLNLGMFRVSTDPLVQKKRFVTDLNEVRRDEKFAHQDLPVVVLSWLIKKNNARLFGILGLDPGSVGIRYYEADRVFKHRPLVQDKPLAASLEAIPLSSANLRRFLVKGELPNVGMVSLSADQFFKSAQTS